MLEKWQKVRKVARSPPHTKAGETSEVKETQDIKDKEEKEYKSRENMDKENLVELIREMLKEEIQEIRKDNRETRAEIKELKEGWRKMEEERVRERKIMEEKIEELGEKQGQEEEWKERLKELEKREEDRERRERRNNIILTGEKLVCKENPKMTAQEVLRNVMKTEAEVEEAFWIKKKEGESMLLVRLRTWEQKREVMIKKSKLKGKRLYVENDLTRKEREVQKNIRDIARAEKARGMQVKIGYRKLKVGDRIFRWEEEEGLRETNFWSGQSSANL